MSEEPILLGDIDVVFVNNLQSCGFAHGHQTFITTELKNGISRLIQLGARGSSVVGDNWVENGVDCRAIFPGSNGWKDGKVFITVLFVPSQAEAVEAELVDEVRQIAPSPMESETSPTDSISGL